MNKIILSTIFSVFLMFGMPSVVCANESIEITDNDFDNISINISGSVLTITGANGQMLQIYNVAGVRVMNVKVEGDERRYDLSLPKGCYIIKVGKYVRKISIR
ncbi:MAG: T9SS type A sorting domain-containing protein [Prevotella sp.]|jgi:uncharacterized protein YxjI|nr:T9SS type A sorting domain-containing protein [Prevotella sp.]MCI1281671.1 T9SS type A sorting domain-containing protein [Prevotella sp.]